MFRAFSSLTLALGILVLAEPAAAAPGDASSVALLGEAPSLAPSGPQRFVLYLEIVEGEKGEKSQASGSFSGLPPSTDSGLITTGACAGKHCDLSVQLDSVQFDLHGDLAGLAGSTEGAFEITDHGAEGAAAKGAVTFKSLPDAVPELGERVKAEALTGPKLRELMIWNGMSVAFNGDGAESFDDLQGDDIATWQDQNHRPKTGVLFTSDLAAMTDQRDKAQKAAGWTPLGEAAGGWTAGYPAVLLPQVSRAGAERRFSSADGKALLVIAVDPPLSQADFEALEASLHSDGDPATGESHHNLIGTGNDVRIDYTVNGKAVTKIYRNREGGVARLVYTCPDGDNPFADIAPQVTNSLTISDALKPTP
jgi:hypothetical protein